MSMREHLVEKCVQVAEQVVSKSTWAERRVVDVVVNVIVVEGRRQRRHDPSYRRVVEDGEGSARLSRHCRAMALLFLVLPYRRSYSRSSSIWNDGVCVCLCVH